MKIKHLLASLIVGLGMTLAFLGLLAAGSMILVHADTYTVTNTNPSGPGSLRQAILNANGNAGHDTIDFGITGTIVLAGPLPAISDDLTITGPGAEQLSISGVNTYRVFFITSDIAVTITEVTVRDGTAVNGGGFWSAGTLHLDSIQIVNNSASTCGGGVYVDQGSVTLNRTQVVSNSTFWGGGGVCIHEGGAILSGTQVVSNSASTSGGGVYVGLGSATLNVSGGRISSNSAAFGGGVFVYQGSATLNGTQVVSNSASTSGGISLSGNSAITAINGCIVFNSDTAVKRVQGTLIATDNWWGTPDGPGGAGPGSGDTVSAGVDYANFKISAPAGCPSRVFLVPEITIAPSDLAFGSHGVNAGPTVSQTVTITNDGNVDLYISAITPTGDTGEFNLADSGEVTMTSGGTRTIEVSFDPSSVGAKVMTLTIHSNDSDEPTVEVILSGTGTTVSQPGYGSDPAPGSSIDVGTANVGSTISATLTISETGAATLVVTPTLSGPDAAGFGFAPTTLTILDGGAVQDLTISCTPSVSGTLATPLTATLTVVHNAPGSPAVYSLSCSGEALYYIYLPLLLRNN